MNHEFLGFEVVFKKLSVEKRYIEKLLRKNVVFHKTRSK